MNLDDASAVRRQLDRYEIVAEIASGGMATVYVGRLNSAPGFERLVAIKKLHPHLEREREFVEMFLDEARIAARLHHPNVVSTLEFGQSQRGFFLVMDYIEGSTLAKLLAKIASSGQVLPQPIALRIVLDALAGLHVAHELTGDDGQPMHVVHRDVSPQNVLLGLDGMARITDFGVARAASRLAVTRTGQLKGKLGYMAPEQAKGEVTDRRADVFAMGILLWESLTCRRLFKGRNDNEADTLGKVLYADIPPVSTVVPDVSPLLDEAVARALERPLDRRFATCADFIDAIEAAAQQGVRIATHREVARFVDEHFGAECAARREALRKLSPVGLDASTDDRETTLDAPRLVTSVSSATMTMADPSQPVPPVHPLSPPVPPRSHPAVFVALGLALVVSLAAVVTMVWVVTRPPPAAPASFAASPSASAPASSSAAPLASSSASALTSAAPSATPAASASSSAQPSASSAPTPSARPPASGRAFVPGPTGTAKPRQGGEDLSSNPYRR